MIGLQRVISVGRLYLPNGGGGSSGSDKKEPEKFVHLDCTGCSLTRTFKKGEIPNRFRGGCPNCKSRFKVEWTRAGFK